jgi:hypothetical protein
MSNVLTITTEKIKQNLVTPEQAAELKRATTFRLSDAIRDAVPVVEQANGWVEGNKLCALSGAVCSARARGYMK